jgi:hypothetical protein
LVSKLRIVMIIIADAFLFTLLAIVYLINRLIIDTLSNYELQLAYQYVIYLYVVTALAAASIILVSLMDIPYLSHKDEKPTKKPLSIASILERREKPIAIPDIYKNLTPDVPPLPQVTDSTAETISQPFNGIPAEKEPSGIYCRYCGFENDSDAFFCQKCGKTIIRRNKQKPTT